MAQEIFERAVIMHAVHGVVEDEHFFDDDDARDWLRENHPSWIKNKERWWCEYNDFLFINGDYVAFNALEAAAAAPPVVTKCARAGESVLIELNGSKDLVFAFHKGQWLAPLDEAKAEAAAWATREQLFADFFEKAKPVMEKAVAQVESKEIHRAANEGMAVRRAEERAAGSPDRPAVVVSYKRKSRL